MDNSYKTAITRSSLSRPAKKFSSYLYGKVLDFGCGKGSDADRLGAVKYDIHFFPDKPAKESFDCVMVNYVLNTVTYPEDVLKIAKEYVKPGGLILVSCRTPKEINDLGFKRMWAPAEDGKGWITGKGTYQRGISEHHLIHWASEFSVVDEGGKDFSWYIGRKQI